jgi:hypothetical protein
MSRIALWSAVAGTALMLVLPGAPAQAQATRTWVSGVGDDVNPCSRTAPCKTWAGAISKTAPGGEIDALDPGGFGGVTITKSITLDGGGGQVASTLVAGTNGIVVSVGASDVVTIRNVRINGLLGNGGNPANAGTNGIRHVQAGTLTVENCVIFGFNVSGIDAATTSNATLNVLNTTITNIGTGGTGNGINLEPGGGTLVGEMDNSTIQKVSGRGITSNAGSVIFTVTRSNILNSTVVGVNSGGGGTVLGVDSSSVSSNNTAFAVNGGKIRISRNVIYDNNTNFTIAGGGTIDTDSQNIVAVNGATVPNGTITKQ